MLNLDIYQNFLSNLIFVGLVLTMIFYWASLSFSKNSYILKLANIFGKACTIILFSYLTWRWYTYKFFPLSNLYESLMFLACLLLILYKIFEIKTKSRIISKGISTGTSKNSYRGFVKISQKACNSRNYSQCDSFLIGSFSQANTYPYIHVQNSTSKVEHEASTSKLGEEQIFYFLQRGISLEETVSLIISGFCQEVFNKLPLEFATEADRLLSLKLEGNIG